jgi:hypothetical protein
VSTHPKNPHDCDTCRHDSGVFCMHPDTVRAADFFPEADDGVPCPGWARRIGSNDACASPQNRKLDTCARGAAE